MLLRLLLRPLVAIALIEYIAKPGKLSCHDGVVVVEDAADVLGVETGADAVAQQASVPVVQLEVEHVVVQPVDELVAQLVDEPVVVA